MLAEQSHHGWLVFSWPTGHQLSAPALSACFSVVTNTRTNKSERIIRKEGPHVEPLMKIIGGGGKHGGGDWVIRSLDRRSQIRSIVHHGWSHLVHKGLLHKHSKELETAMPVTYCFRCLLFWELWEEQHSCHVCKLYACSSCTCVTCSLSSEHTHTHTYGYKAHAWHHHQATAMTSEPKALSEPLQPHPPLIPSFSHTYTHTVGLKGIEYSDRLFSTLMSIILDPPVLQFIMALHAA